MVKMMHFAVLTASLVLTACGDKGEGGKDTQVLARVNGDEITVHQVNNVLARMGVASKEQADQATKEVVERLINQELLLQQAKKDKVDREPGVVQAIEASKREILSQAYMEKRLTQSGKPSSAEVDKFYSEHPELFEHRRIYQIQELNVEVPRDAQADLREKLKGLGNIKQIADWLNANGYKFAANQAVKPAEGLPMPLLPQLQKMQAGDTAILSGNANTMQVIGVGAVQEQAIPREKATPFIERHLASQRAAEKGKEILAMLRKDAKIEYLGAAAKADAGKASEAVKKEPVKPESEKDKAISEGIKGL
jgi:EpsD family peptidyl-prolyl cis-trans isomerase